MVVPSNEKGTGFLRTCYSSEILDGIMDNEEFQAICDAASKVVGRVYSKKRLADTAQIDNYKILLSVISVLLTGIYLGLIYLAIVQD